jgi:hypothetical protein
VTTFVREAFYLPPVTFLRRPCRIFRLKGFAAAALKSDSYFQLRETMMPSTVVKGLGESILPERYRTLRVYVAPYSSGDLTSVAYGGKSLLETSKPAIEVIRAFQAAFRELERQLEAPASQPGSRGVPPEHSPRP